MIIQYFDVTVLTSYLFQFFIVLVIGFLGALLSDIWYYFRHHQRIDIKEDIVVGIVDSAITNFIIGIFEFNSWTVNIRIVLAASFLGGIWGIDIMTIIMNPNKVFSIFKGVLKSSPHSSVRDIGHSLDAAEDALNEEEKKKPSKKEKQDEEIPIKEKDVETKVEEKPKAHNIELKDDQYPDDSDDNNSTYD